LNWIDQADRTLAMEPAFHWGYFFRGIALEQLQRPGDAIDSLRKSVELSGGSTVMLSALGHAYAAAGDLVQARNVLGTVQGDSRQRYVSSYEIALIHAAMGEQNRVRVVRQGVRRTIRVVAVLERGTSPRPPAQRSSLSDARHPYRPADKVEIYARLGGIIVSSYSTRIGCAAGA
jgi:hypothetical protein